ncbi:hypothetical protein QE364_000366 [Nocardioides zeae]|uniref:Uncharacterized protein n=1 Tax=Nocardioides zeae TaxID=1457234 RepID=A0ACC6IDI5_9ACTN|nr:hypothetical protein [Nocardioides zeae]MDR6175749.1 hypothetical protein [Nocardioides zeae]MDR6208678.1 hypothetical protein [Nocardioides zeae]
MSPKDAALVVAVVCLVVGWGLVWRGWWRDNRHRDAKERAGEWPRHPSVRHTTPESRRLQRIGLPLVGIAIVLQVLSVFVL